MSHLYVDTTANGNAGDTRGRSATYVLRSAVCLWWRVNCSLASRSLNCSEPAAWARCIWPSIRGCRDRRRSRSCPPTFPLIRNSVSGFIVKLSWRHRCRTRTSWLSTTAANTTASSGFRGLRGRIRRWSAAAQPTKWRGSGARGRPRERCRRRRRPRLRAR
jgi:hypothetical protein